MKSDLVFSASGRRIFSLFRKLKQTFQYRQMTLEKLLAQETQPG